MRTRKYNGEEWYWDERSLWKRCRQWLIWIGGWEKPNGTGWRFRNSYDRSIFMPPFPVSLLGHLFTFFGWGWQMKLCKLYPFKVYRFLVWSKSGLYLSNDGTPPDSGRNEGRFLYRKRRQSDDLDKYGAQEHWIEVILALCFIAVITFSAAYLVVIFLISRGVI